MEESNPNQTAQEHVSGFSAYLQEIKQKKAADRASALAFEKAWQRAFFWVLLALPLIGLPFWIFLGLGIFRIAEKTSAGQLQGRGYLRGSIIGLLAAIPLWSIIAYSSIYVIERKRQLDNQAQDQKVERELAQSKKRIAEAEAESNAKALAQIADRNLKAERERMMEEERLRLQAEIRKAELAVQREAETARYLAEQMERQQAIAKEQFVESAKRLPAGEIPDVKVSSQEEESAAAIARQEAAIEEARVAQEHQRMQADIDRNRAQYQDADALLRSSDVEIAKLKTEITVCTNRSEVANKLARRAVEERAINSKKLRAEASAASNKLSQAKSALILFERRLQQAQDTKDRALKRLQELGVEPIADFPDSPIEPGSVVQKSYVIKLKGGGEVKAVKAVDGGDVYSVKTDEGEFITVKKADIEEMPMDLLTKK